MELKPKFIDFCSCCFTLPLLWTAMFRQDGFFTYNFGAKVLMKAKRMKSPPPMITLLLFHAHVHSIFWICSEWCLCFPLRTKMALINIQGRWNKIDDIASPDILPNVHFFVAVFNNKRQWLFVIVTHGKALENLNLILSLTHLAWYVILLP